VTPLALGMGATGVVDSELTTPTQCENAGQRSVHVSRTVIQVQAASTAKLLIAIDEPAASIALCQSRNASIGWSCTTRTLRPSTIFTLVGHWPPYPSYKGVNPRPVVDKTLDGFNKQYVAEGTAGMLRQSMFDC